jgi:hypothetical protein
MTISCKLIILGRKQPFVLKLLGYSKGHKTYIREKKSGENSIIRDLDSWTCEIKKSKKNSENSLFPPWLYHQTRRFIVRI